MSGRSKKDSGTIQLVVAFVVTLAWLVALALAGPGIARAAPVDEGGSGEASLYIEIEAMSAALAQQLLRLDEALAWAGQRLDEEVRVPPVRLDAAADELVLVEAQIAAVRAAYERFGERRESGDEEGVRAAFGEASVSVECAHLRLRLVDDLLRERCPWLPEGAVAWMPYLPDGVTDEPVFDSEPLAEPPPPDLLR